LSVIELHLDGGSGVSYYVQLKQQVRQAVRLGILHTGDQLPTVREVVAAVAVNPNTVLRAYRELEQEGLVVSRPGLGTFVASGVAEPMDQPLYRSLRDGLERWVRAALANGVDRHTLAALFDHVLREMEADAAERKEEYVP
jgi:GntR family transcriptional regulator